MIQITRAVSQLIYSYRSNISWFILKFLNNFSFLNFINLFISLLVFFLRIIFFTLDS